MRAKEEVVNDIDDVTNDRDIQLLYIKLQVMSQRKKLEYIQLARSRETGEVRYMVRFIPDDGVIVQDLTTNEETLLS